MTFMRHKAFLSKTLCLVGLSTLGIIRLHSLGLME